MINNPLTRRRPAAAVEPIADPSVDPRHLLEQSGIAAAERNLQQLQADLRAAQDELKALTAQDNKRRQRGPAAANGTNLETVLDLQAQDDALARNIAGSNDKIVGMLRALRDGRDELARLRAELDAALRPLLFSQRQDRIGRITELAMALGDELQADRHDVANAESLVSAAGLRPLGWSTVLHGVDLRFNLMDQQLPFLNDLTKEWIESNLLVGSSAERATARASRLFAEREQASQREAERRAEVERRAKEAERLWRRERLASGEIKIMIRMSDGNMRMADPETAVRRYDEQCGVVPRRKRDAAPTEGALVGV